MISAKIVIYDTTRLIRKKDNQVNFDKNFG